MDVKVVFVIVCLCALAITSTEAVILNCCMRVKDNVKQTILKRVQRWEIQEINDRCDIQALVLYVQGLKKPVCAHPSLKEELKSICKVVGKKNFLRCGTKPLPS